MPLSVTHVFAGTFSFFQAKSLQLSGMVYIGASAAGVHAQRCRMEVNDVNCRSTSIGKLAAARRQEQEYYFRLVESGAKSYPDSTLGGQQLSSHVRSSARRAGVVCSARKTLRIGFRCANMPRRSRKHWNEAIPQHAPAVASAQLC